MNAMVTSENRREENGRRGDAVTGASFLFPRVNLSPLPRISSVQRRAWLILLGLSAMFVTSALWQPSDDGIILCPFRAITGIPCPGCGMTRAFCALAHGHILRAIRYNALSPFLFLAAIIAWMGAAAAALNLQGVRERLARIPRPTPFISKLALALVVIWWIVRLIGRF